MIDKGSCLETIIISAITQFNLYLTQNISLIIGALSMIIEHIVCTEQNNKKQTLNLVVGGLWIDFFLHVSRPL